MRFQFSIRTLGIVVLFVSLTIAAYLMFSRESSRQQGAIELLASNGAALTLNADVKPKFGELLGFKYPFDRVDSIIGMGRSDWGMISRWECDDGDLDGLREFKNLRELRITGSGITNAGLRTIGSLVQIRELEVCGTSVTDAGISALGPLADLEHLDLSGNRIGDEAMNVVSGLSTISSLELTETEVTELGIAKLVDLSKLRRLIIGDLAIRDGAFRRFGELDKLEYIFLNGAMVTDATMDDLMKVKSLKSLNIHRCDISSSAVFRLKNALPECKVVE